MTESEIKNLCEARWRTKDSINSLGHSPIALDLTKVLARMDTELMLVALNNRGSAWAMQQGIGQSEAAGLSIIHMEDVNRVIDLWRLADLEDSRTAISVSNATKLVNGHTITEEFIQGLAATMHRNPEQLPLDPTQDEVIRWLVKPQYHGFIRNTALHIGNALAAKPNSKYGRVIETLFRELVESNENGELTPTAKRAMEYARKASDATFYSMGRLPERHLKNWAIREGVRVFLKDFFHAAKEANVTSG
jgi:hypothetical protein